MKKMEQRLVNLMKKNNSNMIYNWDYCIKIMNLNHKEYMQFVGELKHFTILERKYKRLNGKIYSYFECKEKIDV